MPSALVRKLNDDESGLDDLVNCIVRMVQNAGLERVSGSDGSIYIIILTRQKGI